MNLSAVLVLEAWPRGWSETCLTAFREYISPVFMATESEHLRILHLLVTMTALGGSLTSAFHLERLKDLTKVTQEVFWRAKD